ncbi:MAG: hypothetical protein IPK85_17200 [Gemmatimonadetes bacterium]|nr:hypothetical protein [Gemmatimonadota bacterium]
MRPRLLAACLVTVAPLGPAVVAQAPSGIQLGVVVSPESVTVGDPFRVVIRVRAPRGTVLDFPDSPDTAFAVEPLDRVVLTDGGDTTAVEMSATYRLAAWDVGRRSLRFEDILTTRDGETRRVPVGRDLAVFVATVLPEDTAQRVPRPPRPVYEFGLPWWWWLAVVASALALGGLFWWWWRRRPKGAAPVVDPFVVATRAFARVDALGLLAAGETGQHVTLCTDILRDYLAAARPAARTALTSGELLHRLRGDHTVPLTRLARLLHDADLVKFARRRMSAQLAVAHATECRGVCQDVHAASDAASSVPEAA